MDVWQSENLFGDNLHSFCAQKAAGLFALMTSVDTRISRYISADDLFKVLVARWSVDSGFLGECSIRQDESIYLMNYILVLINELYKNRPLNPDFEEEWVKFASEIFISEFLAMGLKHKESVLVNPNSVKLYEFAVEENEAKVYLTRVN